MVQKKKPVTFDHVLTALLDTENPFSPSYLHQFSDLENEKLAALKKIWPQIDLRRRIHLMEDLEDLNDTDTIVSFDAVAQIGLEDVDPQVRQISIRLLWESENSRLIPIFIQMMEQDADTSVRAAAAQALGQFVYIGELEEIPVEKLHLVEEALLRVPASAPEVIRLRALEALGFSGRDEIPTMIQSAYASGAEQWMASALLAMGRSADPRWEKIILSNLQHARPRVQSQAVRAAGELELKTARQAILELLADPGSLDDDVYMAAIWSLSQIGGEKVREVLEALAENAEDDEETEFIETALENLEFTETYPGLEMFDFKVKDEETLTDIIDLDIQDDDEVGPDHQEPKKSGKRGR